jgi:hypothetical protein
MQPVVFKEQQRGAEGEQLRRVECTLLCAGPDLEGVFKSNKGALKKMIRKHTWQNVDSNLGLTLGLTLRLSFFRAQVQLREAVAVFKELQRRAEEEKRRQTEQENARRRREAVGIEAELRKRREKVCTALRISEILANYHR